MADTYSTLHVSVTDGVAYAVIDNPPVNLLDAALMTDLDRFTGAMFAADDVRVIVFDSADPDFFIAHGDMRIAEDPQSFAALDVASEQDPSLNPMMRLHERIRTLPQITIAKLRGLTRGGGAELLSAMDMRFAAREHAGLAQPEDMMGIIPGAGGTVYLPGLVGRARALEIILSGQLVDAPTAERMGWVNRAVPAAELDHVVDTLAARIATLAPGVARATVEAVDAAAVSTAGGLATANELFGQLFSTPHAGRRGEAALAAGAQTRDGERRLEALIDGLA
ncbi:MULTISPECIES: enoyl-CoA hydratase/isomerase family protein [Streptomyces]|uniref:Enoyl-CoA hydratase/carnithine racemase n=2 Tax=Streptomyces TaxID=1883 RepID=A0ABT9LRU9_STRGD|nr:MULTISPECIES: enoyl-CoA hydratase/isomerase family protein [Streptomyces]MDP9686261.1 enoyl-CoA hydratase/carnithine racemase [Streptomyces griseoviridis]GGT15698.1 enoyl-CoA hydratase [Streptomyces griseoviridis]GGU57588.1 enoyl-CoA hydratase [Streptomyces daghestanicus]GHI35554.1 enoyl-CoA hydratase [Streptomyces daghestanicus]